MPGGRMGGMGGMGGAMGGMGGAMGGMTATPGRKAGDAVGGGGGDTVTDIPSDVYDWDLGLDETRWTSRSLWNGVWRRIRSNKL
jgi:hypothetical protein